MEGNADYLCDSLNHGLQQCEITTGHLRIPTPTQVQEPPILDPAQIKHAAGDARQGAAVLAPTPLQDKPLGAEHTPDHTLFPVITRNAHNLDKGWAWLVMVAALFTHILTFGMSYAIVGAVYVEFLEEFKQSNAATSWTGSIMLGMMLCSGPLISIFIDKFGACAVAVVGGAIASAGLFISSLATSIIFLYFSFGVVTGLGLGMSYLPCIVMLGKFFERRRAFAAGIAASGSGLGTFIFAPFDQFLLANLGWRHSFLVLGALELFLCVCGATYLESKIPVRDVAVETHEANSEGNNVMDLTQANGSPSLVVVSRVGAQLSKQSLNSIRTATDATCHDTPVGSWKQSIGVKMRKSVFLQSPPNTPLPFTHIPLDNFFGLAYPGTSTRASLINPSMEESSNQGPPPPATGLRGQTIDITYASSPSSAISNTTHQPSEGLGEFAFGSWQQSVNARAVLSNFLQSPIISPAAGSPLTLDNISRLSVPSTQDQELSIDLSAQGSQNNFTTTVLDPVPEVRLYPQLEDTTEDNFADSIVPDVIEAGLQYDLDDDSRIRGEDTTRKPIVANCSECIGPLVTICRLFRNRFFVLFSISGFVLCIGYQLPYMYFKAFALSMDIDKDGWALIMACMGITDMLGRLVVGFVFDRATCVPYRLVGYIVSLLLSGGLLLLMSDASTYPTLAMSATTYTLVAGSTDPLVPALLVEYVGLDSLCYSFGMLIEMQGLGFLLGPPLAGVVYAYVQNYSSVFIVGALAFFASGFIILLEPVLSRCHTFREGIRGYH